MHAFPLENLTLTRMGAILKERFEQQDVLLLLARNEEDNEVTAIFLDSNTYAWCIDPMKNALVFTSHQATSPVVQLSPLALSVVYGKTQLNLEAMHLIAADRSVKFSLDQNLRPECSFELYAKYLAS